MNPLPLLPLASLLCLGALPPLEPSPAAPQRNERQIRDDMAFARELAARFQYVDLAEQVLAGLEKENLSEKQKESLNLVQCQVYTESAKREGDSDKRLALFEKASDSYKRFFTEHPYSELVGEAERSYLDLVNNYGRALELALADSIGEETARLRELTKTVLDDGLERTSNLKSAFEGHDLSQTEKFEKWRLMLDRAQMLMTLGNVSPDPAFLYSQAENELEAIAGEAGETSGPGLNALLALAKLNRARARFSTAADFAQYVATAAVPEDASLKEWRDLPFELKAERFKLVELALPELVDSLTAAGKLDKACYWSLYYYNAWKREGFDLSPFGYMGLLSVARTPLDAGGYVGGSTTPPNVTLQWFETEEEMNKAGFSGRNARSALDLALRTAQDINENNKGNILQVRAQKLISDVIERPGVSVSPDVLFEAAQGEYNTKNYAKAIDSFKGILRSLDGRDEATRREYAPKVLTYVGDSLRRVEPPRPLEAAMAYREAATTWKGDPEYQPRAARGYYGAMGDVRRKAGGDPLIEQLYLEAERLTTESVEEGADDIKWRQAERKYGEQDYAAARKGYLEVGEAGDYYEKAIAKAALCLYKQRDLEGAARDWAQYVDVWVKDPKHAITGARKLGSRSEARAQATYYLGKMAYDAQDYDQVVRRFTGYEKEFPEQTEYGANALYMLTAAQLARKDLAAAKEVQATMMKAFPKSTVTGKAALDLFQVLKAEQEKAEQAGEGERARELKGEMARYMKLSNENASEAPFQNLRLESGLWLELEDWVSAEQALRKTVELYGKAADRQSDLERFVLPDLGAALLGQQRVPEAFSVLDPLIPKSDDDPRKPSSSLVRDWCRAVSGWLTEEGGQTVEVPGVGGAENFEVAVDYLGKLIQSEAASNDPGRGAWYCPWYGLKFDQMYANLQWSSLDSSKKDAAKRSLDDIAGQLGDSDFKAIAKECGNETLRSRYLWLRAKVR